jgi:hypothetical protein
MPRPSTVLVIFVVSMNLFAGAFVSMGVMDDIGLADRGGANEDIKQSQSADLNTGSGVGGTLFGMYNVLTQQVQGVYATIYPALDMLERAGMPSELAYGVLGNLFTFVVFFDIISYIRGWGL